MVPMSTEHTSAEQPTAVLAPEPQTQRRVAVLPLLVAGAVLAMGVGGGAVIAMQAGAAPSAAPAAVSAPPAATVPAPQPVPAAEAEPEPDADPLPQAAPNQCLDHSGDAEADIASVTLQPGRRGTVLAVFELAGPLPEGEASLSLLAEGQQRTTVFRAEFDGGRVHRFRAQDEGNRGDTRLDRNDVRLDGTRVVLELPAKLVERLGGAWSWSAFSSVDGMLDDSCGEGLQPYQAAG